MVVGPLAGGFVGGHFGMRPVFLATCVMMAGGALADAFVASSHRSRREAANVFAAEP
jgi:MFS family permease